MAMTLSQSFSAPTAGTVVRDRTGQVLGSVSEIIFDAPTGAPRFAIVALDGDPTFMVVPWEATSFRPGEQLVLNITPEQLIAVPRLDGYSGGRFAQARWSRIAPSAARRAAGALAVLVLAMAAGLGYLLWHPSASSATEQAQRVAGAMRSTTVAIRDTSADTATTVKVKAALALSKRVAASAVSVETRHAVTTLTGIVPSPDARAVAGQIAADTEGVREVRNFLTVEPATVQ
jgi:osmotically-inducible protein OsmY